MNCSDEADRFEIASTVIRDTDLNYDYDHEGDLNDDYDNVHYDYDYETDSSFENNVTDVCYTEEENPQKYAPSKNDTYLRLGFERIISNEWTNQQIKYMRVCRKLRTPCHPSIMKCLDTHRLMLPHRCGNFLKGFDNDTA